MTPVRWMAAAGTVCWIVAVAVLGGDAVVEASLGLAGPFAMAAASWVLAERTYRRNPAQLTPLMVAAFAGKMVFFVAYVVVALSVLSLRPVSFVVSFTLSFVALHVVEAVCLRRLFGGGVREPL